MVKEYEGQYKIIVRWYPVAKDIESRLVQLHKTGEHSWRQETIYTAIPLEKKDNDDYFFIDDPGEITWLPKSGMTNVNELKEKTRQLTFKAIFDYPERLFKNG